VPKEVRDRLNEVRDRVTAQHQQQQEQRAQGFEKYAWAMNARRNEMTSDIRENVLNPIINQQSTERTEALREELRNAMQPTPEPVTQNPERSQDSATVEQPEREQHSQTLAQYLKNTTFQTVQNHVEFIRDYGQSAIEKTVEAGSSIFDKYASLVEKTEKEQERSRERERDYER